jgi:hypothetical protein
MGVGAGIGFFVGPQYAGWRATTTGFWWIDVAAWQLPCIELALVGMVFGVIFFWVAREVPRQKPLDGEAHPPMGAKLRWRIGLIAPVLGLRDFAGVAMLSLASVYLQKAHNLDARQTGFILGAMMLASVVVNPLAVAFSPGGRRLPLLAVLLVMGAMILATVPLWPVKWVLLVLLAFQACQLATYSVADAAVLERVPALVRGRVIGLWLTLAGTLGSIGPVVAGWWTDRMKESAADPSAYFSAFGILAILMALSALSVRMIARIGPPIGHVDIGREIMPETMGTVV